MSEQPDFSTSPRPRRLPVRAIAAIAVGLLALAFSARTAWVARQEAHEAQARLVAVRREIARLEARLGVLDARSDTGRELLARASAAREAPPERIVAALARVLPDDVRVERLDVSYEEAVSLDLRLVARDAAAWDVALDRLAQAASFEEVTPGPERREGELRTSVHARWKGERR